MKRAKPPLSNPVLYLEALYGCTVNKFNFYSIEQINFPSE